MVLGILLPLGLYFAGAAHIRRGLAAMPAGTECLPHGEAPSLPRVGVIVPLTGNTPGMQACLESLLNQSYSNYEVVFVTRETGDPATQLVLELISSKTIARHVLSGPASRCSQKNHNLLSGLGLLGSSPDILVFCDSTHLAPPHFLNDLVDPIIRGQAIMTTGFHRVILEDFSIPTLGMVLTVLAIHLLQAILPLSQPWGGATAIKRKVFEDHRIHSIWAENVVDDMSMGTCLAKHGIRVTPVSTACMETPMTRVTLKNWEAWLTRQLFFLKFCQPLIWAASALVAYLFAAPILLACFASLGGPLGIVSGNVASAGCAFIVIFVALGLRWRTLTAQRVPRIPWIAAVFATNLMVAWCYAKTWSGNILSWRGISYRVGWGGKVREVIPAGDE